MTTHDSLDAGEFNDWIYAITSALNGTSSSEVPCGECTACCTSSQFVHIEPDETATLERIPKKLLFAAPGLPKGNRVMGYDDVGHCPMFKNGRCSIYEHRPRTCRVYDCRVFPAASVAPDSEKIAIAHQSERWQFSYGDQLAQEQHAAVQRAASYLRAHPEVFPNGEAVHNPAQLAVLAIAVHAEFASDPTSNHGDNDVTPDTIALREAIASFVESRRDRG